MHGRGNGSQCVHPAADPNAGLERPFSHPPAPAGFHARVGVTLRPQDAGRRRVRARRAVCAPALAQLSPTPDRHLRERRGAVAGARRGTEQSSKTQLSLRKTKVRRHTARAAMSSEPLVEARPQREGAAVVRHQSVYRCEAILVRRPSAPRDTSGPRLARFRIRRGGSSGADDDSPTLAAATPTRTSNADDAPPGARNSATSSLWTTR